MSNSDAGAAADDAHEAGTDADAQIVEVIVDASGAVIVLDSAAVVDELYERVKYRGYVTTGEIFAALPKLEPETQELADIYASVHARDVQVFRQYRFFRAIDAAKVFRRRQRQQQAEDGQHDQQLDQREATRKAFHHLRYSTPFKPTTVEREKTS